VPTLLPLDCQILNHSEAIASGTVVLTDFSIYVLAKVIIIITCKAIDSLITRSIICSITDSNYLINMFLNNKLLLTGLLIAVNFIRDGHTLIFLSKSAFVLHPKYGLIHIFCHKTMVS